MLTDREIAIAKECLVRGQKDKALLALRRKKYQESLLAKTDAQLEQLQRLTSDVEFAAVQKSVMYGLQQGTLVLKQIHAEMGGIDKVEKLLEENAEARAYQKEISDMLGGQLSNQDEDDVEDELEAMAREMDTEPILPDVPISQVDLALVELISSRDRAMARDAARRAGKEGQEGAEMLAA